ncbi:MFS transporter [Cellulomonas cellasea]|uniref:Major facilitator superfamily (MFS) profile domain-containing protein n=2 Tax=Cellulomonas cellasea TaxID=43670 RepID=A0A0A0BCI8_9CELL|nr:MFS transporter [Cellulomonas cellasea]KGM03893.1 hypothetical protein Q760_07825 [Cellulomonas cellasea DSM 20118]GEA87332.1 MFS transporter [Cellulomonas cellasea]
MRDDGRGGLKRLLVPVYGPAALAMASLGVVTPILALLAIDRGATPAHAALVVGMLSVGGFVGALPSAVVVSRLGDRRSLAVALLIETVAIVAISAVRSPQAMLAAAFVMGLAGAVVAVARQSYLAIMVPMKIRGRALALLGGVFRGGSLVGALLAAGLLTVVSMEWTLLVAAALSGAAAVATYVFVLPGEASRADPGSKVTLWQPGFGRAFSTLGVGGALVMLVRSSRDALLPIWGSELGLSESVVSLVFAVSSAVDLSLFYVAGIVMDRYGRRAAVVPAMIIMGVSLLCLPLGGSLAWVLTVAVLLGLGNGLSSGAVMTIGVDAAPETARAAFLAGWRLVTGIGQSSGPMVVAGVVGVATAGAAASSVGVLGLGGALWLWRWLPGRQS